MSSYVIEQESPGYTWTEYVNKWTKPIIHETKPTPRITSHFIPVGSATLLGKVEIRIGELVKMMGIYSEQYFHSVRGRVNICAAIHGSFTGEI